MKILSIVGTRPQFVKAAALSRALRDPAGADRDGAVHEVLVHTGQHYDANLSAVFFEELGIPAPDRNLGVDSGDPAARTGEIMVRVEQVLQEEKPELVLVYGDCDSTLAGALAAAKLTIPLAHVESGLRSFNREMPEELNRIATDRIADFLYCPTQTAHENLVAEGRGEASEIVGDVMYDCALMFGAEARARSSILARMEVAQRFALCTLHRSENTDSPVRLRGIMAGIEAVAKILPVVMPLHPRTAARMREHGIQGPAGPVTLCEPLSYLDMMRLEMEAAVILTDSGGIQKEAFFHETPCVTLRGETEWLETVELGWNRIAGTEPHSIAAACQAMLSAPPAPARGNPFGHGDAARRIAQSIARHMARH